MPDVEVNAKCWIQSKRSAKAISVAYALFDFEHAEIRRRAKRARRSVDYDLQHRLSAFVAYTYTPVHPQEQSDLITK